MPVVPTPLNFTMIQYVENYPVIMNLSEESSNIPLSEIVNEVVDTSVAFLPMVDPVALSTV